MCERETFEERIRLDERKKCCDEIKEHIKYGEAARDLSGDGLDEIAEQNGMIKAYNILMGKVCR